MSDRIVGSILHGAYGDYYEQALCLKHFRMTHPGVRLRLFAGSESRLEELKVLDFGFAESFEQWTDLPSRDIPEFFQFQVRSSDLRSEVLSQLPVHVTNRMDLQTNHLPWEYLRPLLPLASQFQLGLSPYGERKMREVMRENRISDATFAAPTIGFLWRHRVPSSHVRPYLQAPARELVDRYSALFGRAIERFDCTVLVCGMKVKTTDENRQRVDAKFPEYGLDLPSDRCIHLKGLSWALEMELLSRASVCIGQASGFTEALSLRRGGRVVLIDPPPHYILKLLRHRMPFFDRWTFSGRPPLSRRDPQVRILDVLGKALEELQPSLTK